MHVLYCFVPKVLEKFYRTYINFSKHVPNHHDDPGNFPLVQVHMAQGFPRCPFQFHRELKHRKSYGSKKQTSLLQNQKPWHEARHMYSKRIQVQRRCDVLLHWCLHWWQAEAMIAWSHPAWRHRDRVKPPIFVKSHPSSTRTPWRHHFHVDPKVMFKFKDFIQTPHPGAAFAVVSNRLRCNIVYNSYTFHTPWATVS